MKYVMTVCSCHVTYAFQSESTLYSCLNVKELLARSRREIWRWSNLNLKASLAKWLSVRLRTKWFWVRVQLQKYVISRNVFKLLIKVLIKAKQTKYPTISKFHATKYRNCVYWIWEEEEHELNLPSEIR